MPSMIAVAADAPEAARIVAAAAAALRKILLTAFTTSYLYTAKNNYIM
jgi:hypothetical protein